MAAIAGIIGWMASCRHSTDISEFDTVCFEREILPLFANSCGTTGCHDAASSKDGYDFTTYDGIIQAVKPFDANGSKAYRAITGRWEMMPPSGPLSKDLRTKIWLWIEQGAEATSCGEDDTVAGVSHVCFTRDIMPVLLSNCAKTGCHDNISKKEGIDVTSYTALMNSGIINNGNPNSSELYKVISKSPGSEDIMPPPPDQPLPKAVRDSIYRWIALGAKNETCASACDTTGTITWTAKVAGIVSSNCTGCHSGTTAGGGIKLTTYTEVTASVNSGKLLPAIKRSGPKPMPPTASMSACDIRTIELWKTQNLLQ